MNLEMLIGGKGEQIEVGPSIVFNWITPFGLSMNTPTTMGLVQLTVYLGSHFPEEVLVWFTQHCTL